MTTSPSICSFVRKQLDLKGKTFHNGRGIYEMRVSKYLDYADVKTKLLTAIFKWERKGIIQTWSIDVDDVDGIKVVFTDDCTKNGNYRTVVLNKQMFDYCNTISCLM